MNIFDIAVIGGGASGFMAAISAKYYNENLKVLILEKSERALKKLNVTGNGQGNFSNKNLSVENYFNNGFCKFAIENFNNTKTVAFFENLGIKAAFIDNRIYPVSLQASALSDSLRLEADRLKIDIKLNYNVVNIRFADNIFTLNGEIKTRKVIACFGGAAGPQFNTDGSAYELLTKFNHKLITPIPSLVQIKTDTTYTKMLKGIKICTKANVIANGELIKGLKDELLFCDYGLSGKVIFELSPYISRCLNDKKDVKISLSLFEDIDKIKVFQLLFERRNLLQNRTIESFFTGLINKQLGKIIFKTINQNDFNLPVKNLTNEDLTALAGKLLNLEFKVLGTMGFKYAQTTIGGIDAKGFNDKTLMSKIIPNLFIAGEALDIDGECGGYNLQWAWSSGYLAGSSAAKI